MFKVSSASKEDVISHFKNQHNCFERSIADDAWFVAESGGFLRSIIERKAGAPSTPSDFLRLFSRQVPELSPLFLIHGNVNHVEGLLSVGCVKISNSKFNMGVQYGIEFQITRNGNPIYPFPIGGSVIVISVSQTPQMLKVAKVTFPIEMLKDIGFGMKMGDSLAAKIVHVTN
ncbi:hypothetical protein Ocin01_15602 [Orchesella cincta]|uniref:Uncharacterized protein n=1 Tax=Orchesella cincta TaxID=48709 RepID=A0A1D2MDL8_ORCCI|nr:hypothetical protein Ocin01_15602 [Orchesella cincta]